MNSEGTLQGALLRRSCIIRSTVPTTHDKEATILWYCINKLLQTDLYTIGVDVILGD
jgi:hypothetical protein